MKRSQLEAIIREAISEVLSEADISPAEKTAKDAKMKAIDAEIKALQVKKGDLASGREKVAEGEIDELANVAVRYELSPDVNPADFSGKKGRIITAMQAAGEPMSKMDVAAGMGYNKQNPINADFMALVANGTIVPSGAQAAPRLNRPAVAEPEDGEEIPAGEEGPEGGVAGEMSDEEIEASFARAMGSGDEEPDAGEIETGDISAASMSDEDYEAFMQYTDLESRLAKIKSDILKTKRAKRDIGDISDQPTSVDNLRALKDKLQKKMNDLLASSEYLRKRQAKLTGKPIEEPKVDDEESLDEWMKGRMQYYAGIKK